MPDFQVQFSGGLQVPWIDAKSSFPEAASRVQNDPDHLRSYRRYLTGTTVIVQAVVGGIVAPLDAALGGRLFYAVFVEWSGDSPPPIASPAGQSSVCTIGVTSAHRGHFILRMRRTDGGSWLVPFDVEAP